MINTNRLVERGRHSNPPRVTKFEIGLLSASIAISGLGLERLSADQVQHRADCLHACAPVLGSLANRITLADSIVVQPSPVALPHFEAARPAPKPKPTPVHQLHKPKQLSAPSVPKPQPTSFVIPKAALRRSVKTNDIGNDVSYPDCPRVLPQGQLFGIVGINHGKPDNTNNCLARELQWATTSTASSKQQSELYINTANPGAGSQFWPKNNTNVQGQIPKNPYGPCNGQETTACAWQYGWNRSATDIESRFKPAARAAGVPSDPSKYFWWLDVETPNSWQKTDGAGRSRNTAVLQGMTSALQHRKANVGVYSTGYQWGKIVGDTELGNLQGLPEWIPGAGNKPDALTHCDSKPFTEGARIVLVQFTQDVDYDLNCPR
jgi:hypothetical protein